MRFHSASRNYNTEGFNQFAKSIQTDHTAFVKAFSQNIFQGGKVPEGFDWMKR